MSDARSNAMQNLSQAARQLGREGTDIDMVGRYVLATGGTLLAAGGLRQGGFAGFAMALAGCGLIWRAAEGRPLGSEFEGLAGGRGDHVAGVDEAHGPVTYREAITIGKPRAEIYRYFRNFENLPSFMTEIERIEVKDDKHSHWVVKAPGDRRVEWDSEVHDEAKDERIGWRTVGDAEVHSEGVVEFKDAPGDRGTEVHVTLRYEPPGGRIGSWVAWLTGREPQHQLKHSLRRLKTVMEVGAV